MLKSYIYCQQYFIHVSSRATTVKVAPVKRLASGIQPGEGSDVHLLIPWILTMSRISLDVVYVKKKNAYVHNNNNNNVL